MTQYLAVAVARGPRRPGQFRSPLCGAQPTIPDRRGKFAYDRANVRPRPRPPARPPRRAPAWPTADPRSACCLPRSRRSRIAATARAAPAADISPPASIRRLSSSLVSSSPVLLVTSPSTTILLPARHEAQRLEPAGAIGVVFHEIRIGVDLVEQHLGHRLVAARSDPGGAEIAAAEMHRDGHALRLAGDRPVEHAGVDVAADCRRARRGPSDAAICSGSHR